MLLTWRGWRRDANARWLNVARFIIKRHIPPSPPATKQHLVPLMNLEGDKQRPIDRRQASRHLCYRFILREKNGHAPTARFLCRLSPSATLRHHPPPATRHHPSSLTDCFNYFRLKVMDSVARSILWTNIVLLLPVRPNERGERERERKKRHVASRIRHW